VDEVVFTVNVAEAAAVEEPLKVSGPGSEQVGGLVVPPVIAQLRATEPVKPFAGVTVTVWVVLPPGAKLIAALGTPRLKNGDPPFTIDTVA
jgi:hypothetical protein